MAVVNLLIVLWVLAATVASFSVHPHRLHVYLANNNYNARRRLTRSVSPRFRVTQLTIAGDGVNIGPDDNGNSVATNTTGGKNHYNTHHAGLQHLKELMSSKIEALESRVMREGENFQREINTVRSESENRISASETSYRDINQANEGKSQARYDAIMMGINVLGTGIADIKAEQQAIKAEQQATKKSVDEMKNFLTVGRFLWAFGSALFGAGVALWSIRKQLGWG
jgi:hypothetical protein